jgi:trk system potassium uptake protein TrkA
VRDGAGVLHYAVHIIVVGCGRVGAELARTLVAASHDVTVVDKDERAFERLAEGWGGRTVRGFGFDRDTLEAAEIRSAFALAAVTSGDNSNVLTARIARETYEVPQVVARIYDPRRAVIYQRLGIPTVATVTWTVGQAMRRLFPHEAVTEWTDATGEVVLVERALPGSWVGRSLDALELLGRTRLVSVSRAGQAKLARPGLIGQEGDILYLAVHKESLDDLAAQLGVGR